MYFDFEKAYTAAKNDKDALESLLLQFGILPNTSVRIKRCARNPNRYIFTDYGTPKYSAFQQGKGYDIAGLIGGIYPKNATQQIQILTSLGYGNFPSPKTNNGATQNPNKGATTNPPKIVQKKVQKKGIPQGQIHPKNYTATDWNSQTGKDLLAYFEQKTGCGDVDFLTKHGVIPVIPQYCKHQYIGEARGLEFMRKVEPKNKQTARGYRVGDWSNFPQNSYLFGIQMFPVKPKSTDIFIHCEGHTDAICGNFHLNKYGVYFGTVGSATTGKLSEGETNNLISLFSKNNLFALGDNDKVGIEGSKKFADAHGFRWIDAKAFFGDNLKDICEAWDKALNHFLGYPNPKETAQKFLLEQFAECTQKTPQNPTQSTIPAITGDRFSISVERAYIHNFDQYLGEGNSLNTVLDFIVKNPRLMIQSPAGTGKSTIIKELANLINLQITVVTPTTAIGEQLYKSFEAQKIDAYFFCNEKTRGDKNAQIWITTFDSIEKQQNNWDNSLLIIDEFHQIANDNSYRPEAMQALCKVALNPLQPAVLLSATPNYLFCSNLTEGFNFTPLLCYPKTTNRINTRAFEYDANIRQGLDFVLKNKPNTEGSILLKYDDFTTLTAWKEYLISLGYTVELFCSKDAKYKENNLNYQSVMDTGLLKTHADFILTTTLLEAGVSLKFPVSLVCAFDNCGSWARDIQLATRARFDAKTGVNKTVDFWLFFSSKRGKTAKDNPLHKSTQKLTSTQIFTKHYQIAKALANNHLQPNGVDVSLLDNLSIDTYKQKFIYQSEKGERYGVDVPAILGNIYELETFTSDIPQILERIKSFDPRFNIQPLEQISIQKTPFLTNWFANEKIEKEARKQAFAALFLGNTLIRCAFIASFVGCKDDKKRQRLSDYLGEQVTKKVLSEGREFKEANPYAFEARGKTDFCIKIFDLLKTTNPSSKKPYTIAEAVQKLTDSKPKQIRKETDAQKLKRLLKSYKKDKSKLSEKDRTFVEEFLEVHKVFEQIQKNQHKGNIKPKPLTYFKDRLNDNFPKLNKQFTEKTALAYIEQFYNLELIRKTENKKTVRLYKVLGVKKFE